MNFIFQTSCLCLMVAVRRAPSGAPALGIHRSTNLRTAATLSFSSDEVVARPRNTYMFKVTPNPPNTPDLKFHQAAQRAIDHYLNPATETIPETTALFSVTSSVSNEILIANSYETTSSISALLLDLSDELTGKDRDVALAIHQLSELSVLLIGKLMDRETPCS